MALTLAPLPPLTNSLFIGNAPGSLTQSWSQYLASLDALIRTVSASLPPIPPISFAVIQPETGDPTIPWATYWASRDVALRNSGWVVGSMTASQVLMPMPNINFSMVFVPIGVLSQAWAQYFSSVDALARPQV